MNQEMTIADVLLELQRAFQRLWNRIYCDVVVPMNRWLRTNRGLLARLGILSRRRPRNSRVRIVQAKRARLLLPMSGKYKGMTRRESYAAVQYAEASE